MQVLQVMQAKSRLSTLKRKDSAIYRKIKNLNGERPFKVHAIFQKHMFQWITNITLSLLEPNCTSSHNAVNER